jgi:hypothetical protein
MHYLVTWNINIEAESAQEAVEKAKKIQLDPYSTANYFHAKNEDTGEDDVVDLDYLEV